MRREIPRGRIAPGCTEPDLYVGLDVGISSDIKSLICSYLPSNVAERVGFEPTCPLRDKTLSRRPRYDHFGTSPQRNRPRRTFHFTRSAAQAVTLHIHLARRSPYVEIAGRGTPRVLRRSSPVRLKRLNVFNTLQRRAAIYDSDPQLRSAVVHTCIRRGVRRSEAWSAKQPDT